MTLTRKLIIAFWVFIITMLLWEFYDYNQGMTQKAIEHPDSGHFFAYQSNHTSAMPPPKPVYHGPALKQVAYVVQRNVPSPGNFTCVVTIQNVGTKKATNIQVHVRPYRGIMNNDEDVYRNAVKPIDDNDPLAQIGQWIAFPDLAPGQTDTETVSFLDKPGIYPGRNPDPEMTFDAEKAPPSPQDISPRRPAEE